MSLFKWSRTAANNATADPSAQFPEGMAAAALNDGARGQMAAVAKYRDDGAGAIVTSGSSSAYTVASFQGFDTLAHLDGQVVAFSPHTTNVDTVTLNVDGLGAKPLRSSPGVELVAGTLIQGTPYVALYSNADAAFYLRGFVSSPYNVPFLGGMDFWDTITPNSAFIFPAGQAISRTVYAKAFARWGTTFGNGDGATTFNVPDKRGRMSAMIDATGSRLTGSYLANAGSIGTAGGADGAPLAQNQLPNAGLSVSGSVVTTSTAANVITGTVTSPILTTTTPSGQYDVLTTGSSGQGRLTSSSANTGGSVSLNTASMNGNVTQAGLSKLPPLITCNYIIRIL